VPIESISHVAFNGAPFTCLAVSALTMDVPVIDFMVINIIVIATLLQCQMLILLLKISLYIQACSRIQKLHLLKLLLVSEMLK